MKHEAPKDWAEDAEDLGDLDDNFPRKIRNIFWFAVVPCLVFWAIALWAVVAWSHDALPTAAMPQGWQYPYSCCSGVDCREAPEGSIAETPQGYRYKVTGDVVKYLGDARLRQSPDGKFHICTVAGEATGRTLCLFAPPRGM